MAGYPHADPNNSRELIQKDLAGRQEYVCILSGLRVANSSL